MSTLYDDIALALWKASNQAAIHENQEGVSCVYEQLVNLFKNDPEFDLKRFTKLSSGEIYHGKIELLRAQVFGDNCLVHPGTFSVYERGAPENRIVFWIMVGEDCHQKDVLPQVRHGVYMKRADFMDWVTTEEFESKYIMHWDF